MKHIARQNELPWSDEPYRLAAENAVDFERVQALKAKAESDRKEASKGQAELIQQLATVHVVARQQTKEIK